MNPRIYTYLFLSMILCGIIWTCATLQKKDDLSYSRLHLSDRDISLIVVDTPALREQGLSGRANLPDDKGMFFVFETPDRYAFWMKDMKFPIDIVWLDGERRIIYIESALSPDTFPKTFAPSEKALYALEVNAHFAEKNNLKVGDILTIDLIK